MPKKIFAKGKISKKDKKVLFASSNVKITADAEGLTKFRIVAYTGGEMRWWHNDVPRVCDLTGAKFATASLPILRDHYDGCIVGHTTENRIENNQVILSGVISGTEYSAKEVADTGKNGFPWQASIGADYETLETYNEGQAVTVNGRVFRGPLEVVRGLTIYETSFCVFGADGKTSAQVFAKKNKVTKGSVMKTFEEWADENGHDLSVLTEQEIETLRVEYDAWVLEQETVEADDDKKDENGEPDSDEEDEEKKTEAGKGKPKKISASNPPKHVANIRSDIVKETKRINAIRKISAGKYPALEAKAIETGMSEKDFEIKILKIQATQNRKPPMRSYSAPDAPQWESVLQASALMAYGTQPTRMEKLGYDQKVINAAMESPNRNVGLRGIIAACVQSSGGHLEAGLSPSSFYDNARNELNRHRIQAAGSSFSTLSLPGILSNIANKSLLDGYQLMEPTILKVAKQSTHKDFKGMTSYRLGSDGDFRRIPAGGRIQSMGLSEESYENKIETWGRLIQLDRQMIINDDLGAFTNLPRELGMKGARTLEREGWQALLNGLGTLFTAAHGNTMTTALSVAGYNQAAALLAKTLIAKDEYSGFLGKYVIVPTELDATANELYTSTTLYETTGNNPVYNKYEPIVAPYFSGTPKKPATNGTTQWILMTDPNLAPLIDLALLDGKLEPTVEDETAAFDVLGVQIRAYFDFGFGLMDWRGAVYSSGTTQPV
ncbi:MAG: hypothetical protein LBQ54_02185 [Planctomycetaceae bacterium]|jgi:hypothetical protein|nr:hypothetical protein [Planctomycetaceae bacterium]